MQSCRVSAFAVSLCVLLTSCSSRSGTIAGPGGGTAVTAAAKFVYTGNEGSSLSGFSVDANTGALTPLPGFPLAFGVNPTVVATDPKGRFLFVGDVSSSTVTAFAIDGGTGGLTQIGATLATIKEPVDAVVDPSGTHLYLSGMGSNVVGAYSIGSSGVLTPVAGQPFSTGGTQMVANGLVMNAAGSMLYVQESGGLYAFSVDSASGGLRLVQTVTRGAISGGLALDPAGNFLYSADASNNVIAAYSVSPVDGTLTLAKTSPADGGYTLAVTPSGKFAFAYNTPYLWEYTVNNGGFTLLARIQNTFALRLGIDPSGGFVYVPQACSQNCPGGFYNAVSEFSLSGTGSMTLIPGSPVAAGVTPQGIAFVKR